MRRQVVAKGIGWYQVAAGCVGVALAATAIGPLLPTTPPESRWQVAMLLLGMLLLFVAVVIGGALLIRSRRWGWQLSVAVQLLQVPIWSTESTRWGFFAGAYLAPVLAAERITFVVGLKAAADISWANQQVNEFIGVNVAPLLIIWAVMRYARPRDRGTLGDGPAMSRAATA